MSAVAVLGGSVKKRAVAGPGVIVKNALVDDVRPAAVAVSLYPTPLLSMNKFANVATPDTAATVVVPASVAPGEPVPLVIASVTLPV